MLFFSDFCFIDGICYSNGQTQLQKDCLVCQTNSSRTDWTLQNGKMLSIIGKNSTLKKEVNLLLCPCSNILG